MAFYNGKNEYRWSYINMTQGHYPLHKNLDIALKEAKQEANKSDSPVTVQIWKSDSGKGKKIYIVRPFKMKTFSKNTLISYYKDKGYDIKFIKPKKYVLK